MSAFYIEGGHRLSGTVAIQGAKNSVLPILAATILSGSVSVIHNCPPLTDVDASIAILRHLGCVVTQNGTDITVDSGPMDRCDIPERLMREIMLEGNAPLMDRSKALACVGYIEEARRDILGNVRHVYAVRNLLLKIGG